ncbi:MAG TPA: hypothetical protein VMF08_17665 [Candidatus Sulfotelmatobacter sp.]|nr:hypothetical protein [Candidatus Sulfotelmatobacter sp.]
MGWLFIVPVVWFLTCYYSVKFYLLATRKFQIAVAGLAVTALITALVLHEQTTAIYWTPHGLNPNHPGFKPQVVVLCGTYDVMEDGTHVNHLENVRFEIRMRGSDFYYSRRWNTREWEIGSWYQMQLAMPGCAWQFGLRETDHETGGGGGSWYGQPGDLIPARRLWDGTNFIGANTNGLTAEEPEWHIKEEFQKLQKVGPYLIPRRIIYTVGQGGPEDIYTVKKVEFWNEPSTNWFWKVRQKYVDGATTNDLHEPNW